MSMTRAQMLLIKIMEECNEVGQRASKALCFGLDEVQEGQSLNNAERMLDELEDLVVVMRMLAESDKVMEQATEGESRPFQKMDNEAKKAKVERWLKYSQSLGILAPDAAEEGGEA